MIQVVDMFRKRALRVADSFVQAGRLDDPNQIFDLTVADIDHALADPSLDLRAIAAERVVLINKIKRSHLVARVIDSRGKIFYPPRKATADGELAGTPISPGVVQGRVKVLRRADEKKLLPGEILVTRATDPGWTPLFINAGGIILEIGGALQHGAVVAREYGIPCVSGLDRATELLVDGQRVEVDGSNGMVRILDGVIPKSQPISEGESQDQRKAEERREAAKAKQKRQQTLLRIIPLVLFPIVILGLFLVVFTLVNLFMGQSFGQVVAKLSHLWTAYRPYINGLNAIIALPIILAVLWRNRDGIKHRLRRLIP